MTSRSLTERLSFLRFIDPDFYVDSITERVHKKFKVPKKTPLIWKFFDYFILLVVYLLAASVLYNALGLAFGTSEPLVIVTSGSMEPVFYRGDVMVLNGVTAESLNAPEITLSLSGVSAMHVRDFATLNYENDASCRAGLNQLTGQTYLLCPKLESITFTAGVTEPVTIPIETTGDVVVYDSPLLREEIIHRVVVKLNTPDGVILLTKGDNVESNKTIDQDCVFLQLDNGVNKFCTITEFPIKISEVKGKSVFRIPLVGYAKLLLLGQ